MVSEVVCHDLMALKTPGIFCESASLAKACKPTKLLQELVAKHFPGNGDVSITTCLEAKLPPAGSCHKGDYVFLKGSGLKLCQVWLHVAIGPQLMSMVSKLDLLQLDSTGCHGTFQKVEGACFIETDTLACAVPYMPYKD